MSKNYFEVTYKGPFKGLNDSLPEDVIGKDESPFLTNFTLKNGEIRSRPRHINNLLASTPDKLPIRLITSFLDSNNVFHTVAVTDSGLWQLNSNWQKYLKNTWILVGKYTQGYTVNGAPVNSSVFVNKFFWVNGGPNMWFWDGITSAGNPATWQPQTAYKQGVQILDSNGNLQVASNSGISAKVKPVWSVVLGGSTTDNGTTPITWSNNGKPAIFNGFQSGAIVDATNGITAGAYFIIELNSQLLMLNTVESSGGNFAQRIRWCPSGLPTIWDPNVNVGAGYTDELDVPDAITGAFTVGTTAFILRNNGITEVTTGNSGENPFNFNHLWASDRGIGNVFPFGYASYGPLGIFLSAEDIYNVSLGGFNKIGNKYRDTIYKTLSNATGIPIGTILPYYSGKYVYHQYRLMIPQGNGNITYIYSIEDQSWQQEANSYINFTGIPRWSYMS